MNIALWVVQALLALGFVWAGWMKTFGFEKAKASWKWANAVSPELVAFIGIAEFLGAVGLIVPQATGIAPVLTPLAATGLAIIMVLGASVHLRRQEYKDIIVNIVFLALALFVIVGRM